MENPRHIVFEKLDEIPGVTIYQNRPETIDTFPSITFSIQSNVPNYVLEKEISHQRIVIKLDIWANSSSEAEGVLDLAEAKMRELDFLLQFNQDVPDPDEICHLTTQFIY